MGILFDYPSAPETERSSPIVLRSPGHDTTLGVGLIGAGAFARTTLMPALKDAGFTRFVSVASASGMSAMHLGEREGFEKAVSGADAVIGDPAVDVVVVATPHDSHARLTAQALRAGKHVFCEKPLALTVEELDDVEAAWAESGKVLAVGFNRRCSEAVRSVYEHFEGTAGPLVITYRVNAGSLPASHWYHDRRHGGRLLGEICHFIDTCAAIVGSDAVSVHAMACGTSGEHLLVDNVVVTLRYPDGCLATISYASGGHGAAPKEWIEVLGRGRAAIIDNFRRVSFDGQTFAPIRGDMKGHKAEMAAFRNSLYGRVPPSIDGIASTRTTLVAAGRLSTEI
jgi:predicted dehydrogenase